MKWLVMAMVLGTLATADQQQQQQAHPQPQEQKEWVNSFAVHIPGGREAADRVAQELGFHNVRQVGPLKDYYEFRRPECNGVELDGTCDSVHRHRRSDHHETTLQDHPEVHWVEQQHRLHRQRRGEPVYLADIKDPKFSDQWYLFQQNGFHINVASAWEEGYSGKGVVVTVVDDGLEHDHPDIAANYDPKASTDLNDDDDDPYPRREDPINKHGTRCAGEIAALKNRLCGVGVAFNSRVGGVRMLDGLINDVVEAHSLGHASDYVDIYTNSWGPNDDGVTMEGPGRLASEAFVNGVTNGRGGKGSIFLFASGNGGPWGDQCNCDGYANSIYTIAIGAITERDTSPAYTEQCAAVLAVMYSSGYGTRDITTIDIFNGCTNNHGGTSAAAPLAAGVYALLLEANPDLTWRDVQHLTARSAKIVQNYDADWEQNGAGVWSHPKYGFGLLDVANIIEMGRTWENVEPSVTSEFEVTEIEGNIPRADDHDGALTVRIEVSEDATAIRNLEHVQLHVRLSAQHRGDMVVDLISPMNGMHSNLLSPRSQDDSSYGIDWTFMSVRHWDEDPTGTWLVYFRNGVSNSRSATLHSVKLIIHGTADQAKASGTCTENEFKDEQTGQCKSCHSQCDGGCTGPTAADCTRCLNFNDSGKCVKSCTKRNKFEAETKDGEKICKACHEQCKNGCDGPGADECHECKNEEHAGKCVATCQEGSYLDDEESCQPCDDQCMLGCEGPGPTNCEHCKYFAERLVQADSATDDPDNKKHPQFVVQNCVSECPLGTYADGQDCKHCDPECRGGCKGQGPLMCHRCQHSLLPIEAEIVSESGSQTKVLFECVKECPPQTFESRQVKLWLERYPTRPMPEEPFCLKCDAECSGCGGPGPEYCKECVHVKLGDTCVSECEESQFADENSECIECDSVCAQCTGPTADDCVKCARLGFEGTCVEQCPPGTFVDEASESCIACHDECDDVCFGPGADQCFANAQATGNPTCKHVTMGNTCISVCPENFFEDDDTCTRCNSECKAGCSGPAPQDCDECKDPSKCMAGNACPKFHHGDDCVDDCPASTFANDKKACIDCDPVCASCTGSSPNDCTECAALTFEGACVAECPENTIEDDDECVQCDDQCTGGCFDVGPKGCVRCKHVALNGVCKASCPEAFFADSKGECLPCASDCASCSGPKPTDCDKCKENAVRLGGVCSSTCPANQFLAAKGECVDCHEECEGCTGRGPKNCKACSNFFDVSRGRCVHECRPTTYATDGMQCKDCNEACSYACNGPSVDDCLEESTASTEAPDASSTEPVPETTSTKKKTATTRRTTAAKTTSSTLRIVDTTKHASIDVGNLNDGDSNSDASTIGIAIAAVIVVVIVAIVYRNEIAKLCYGRSGGASMPSVRYSQLQEKDW